MTFEGVNKIQDVLTVLIVEVTKKGHIIGPIRAISPKPVLLDQFPVNVHVIGQETNSNFCVHV